MVGYFEIQTKIVALVQHPRASSDRFQIDSWRIVAYTSASATLHREVYRAKSSSHRSKYSSRCIPEEAAPARE